EHDRGDAGALETVSGGRARAVVIRERVVRPRVVRQEALPLFHDRAETLGDPRLLEEMEIERELKLIVVAVIAHVTPQIADTDLADGHAIAVVRVEHPAPSAVDLVHLVEIPVPPAWP